MNNAIRLGGVVLSTQGHDKGQYYVVVGFQEGKVLVCDGKYKLLNKPKPKNPIHLKAQNYIDLEIAKKLNQGQKINDQMIYHTILKFKKSIKEKMYG